MITDLKELLQSIGYTKLTDDGSYWRTNAVYREGDNKTALRIHKKTGKFSDFVAREQGSIEDLIKLTLKIGDVELKKFYEGNQIDLSNIVTKNERPLITMEKTWDESELTKMLPHYKFYEDKGISKETLKFFKGGFAHSGSMNQRFVFPIFNSDGRIHGWSGRDMTGKKEAKWKHIGKKAFWVYPVFMYLDKFDASGKFIERTYPVLEAIRKKKEVILVESIGDMLALWQRGIFNVIVTFGLVLSGKLGAFLLSLDIDYVIVALNNDYESEVNRGKVAALDMFIDLMHYVDSSKIRIALPESNDFGVINDEQFDRWTANKNKVSKQVVGEVLDVLRERYKAKKITAAEMKFGKRLKDEYETIEGD